MLIREDDLAGAEIAALLREHLESMRRMTPPQSVHALDLEALRASDVTLWTAWEGDELVGCAALKELEPSAGEIKSMHTVAAHRRRGVASRLLEHLSAEAQRRGYRRLLLETAALSGFEPARALYRKHGFVHRGPFAGYTDDPNTVFMEKELTNRPPDAGASSTAAPRRRPSRADPAPAPGGRRRRDPR